MEKKKHKISLLALQRARAEGGKEKGPRLLFGPGHWEEGLVIRPCREGRLPGEEKRREHLKEASG